MQNSFRGNTENHLNIFYWKLQDKDCYGMPYIIIKLIGWPERRVRLDNVFFFFLIGEVELCSFQMRIANVCLKTQN